MHIIENRIKEKT